KAAVVITGGFAEVGNVKAELALKKLADEHDVALIGPNCMGVLNPAARVDSVFLPIYKMGRPHSGPVTYLFQSGAVGGCVVDMAARAGMGMSKFVSYGNATVIDETDLLQYMSQDQTTGVVVSYLEGVRDGRRFMEAARAFTAQKPLVILKAGKTRLGAQAAASHTAAMAGSYEVYSAAFEQVGAVQADGLDELFDLAKIFALPRSGGPRVAVVTNGGGNGVLAADAISEEGLSLAPFSPATKKALAGLLPPYTNLRNPLDLIGDADAMRYEKALQLMIADPNVDALVVIVLFQTASLDSSIVNVLAKAAAQGKPLVVVSTGGEYTEMHRRILDSSGVPTYSSPDTAVKALAHFLHYNNYWCRYHPKEKMCECRRP
ncbi:MAG: CoA-binding protein, partial [Candidatus Micrarchaeota archaeon]|nr:CoA-binding protein [Candidatus Micrarchaeota archaeon]